MIKVALVAVGTVAGMVGLGALVFARLLEWAEEQLHGTPP